MASIVTPIATLCFAQDLMNAKAAVHGGDPRFSCILLFDESGVNSLAYTTLADEIMKVLSDKFGKAKMADPGFVSSLRSPLRNANEKSYAGFDKGVKYISAWSKSKPEVLDIQGQKILVPEDVFSGQLARASVRPFAYETNGNKGCALGLEHVQIVKADMPRQDGRQSAEAAFSGAAFDPEQMKAMGIEPAGASKDDPLAALGL